MMRAFWLTTIGLLAFFMAACSSVADSDQVIYDVVSDASLSSGDALPAPTGEVVLTIEGAISNTNVGDTAQFDLETLERLGLVSYDVDDPFVKRNIVYTGVLMSDLLDVVGVDSGATTLELVALNDYSATANISDMRTWPFMFGLRADSKNIPADEGGPAIIIIPFNDYPDDLTPVEHEALWVWSMSRIVIQ